MKSDVPGATLLPGNTHGDVARPAKSGVFPPTAQYCVLVM